MFLIYIPDSWSYELLGRFGTLIKRINKSYGGWRYGYHDSVIKSIRYWSCREMHGSIGFGRRSSRVVYINHMLMMRNLYYDLGVAGWEVLPLIGTAAIFLLNRLNILADVLLVILETKLFQASSVLLRASLKPFISLFPTVPIVLGIDLHRKTPASLKLFAISDPMFLTSDHHEVAAFLPAFTVSSAASTKGPTAVEAAAGKNLLVK